MSLETTYRAIGDSAGARACEDDGAPIITMETFARWVGLSKPTIYRQIRDGDMPPRIRLSKRRIGFRRVDVERWIEAQRLREGNNAG